MKCYSCSDMRAVVKAVVNIRAPLNKSHLRNVRIICWEVPDV